MSSGPVAVLVEEMSSGPAAALAEEMSNDPTADPAAGRAGAMASPE
jgi:hypothetical protein